MLNFWALRIKPNPIVVPSPKDKDSKYWDYDQVSEHCSLGLQQDSKQSLPEQFSTSIETLSMTQTWGPSQSLSKFKGQLQDLVPRMSIIEAKTLSFALKKKTEWLIKTMVTPISFKWALAISEWSHVLLHDVL